MRISGPGRWPFADGPSPDKVFDLLFGALFFLGGVRGLLLTFLAGRLPPVVHAVRHATFMLLLGVPFLYGGIADPAGIETTVSLMGRPLSSSSKTEYTLGSAMFIAVGGVLVASVPLVWRMALRDRSSDASEDAVESAAKNGKRSS